MTHIHKALWSLRTVFCVLLLLSQPVLADDSTYRVDGVEVDVTASNAVEAREKAFEEAQINAFEILVERLLTEYERENFEFPNVDTISSFVQDFEVSNEQLSAIRYKGIYAMRFRPDSVQEFLGGRELSYSDIPSEPVLILPYMQTGSRTNLWQNNPFMRAWSQVGGADRANTQTMVPMGDLLDVTQIKDDPALRYDKVSLDNMVRRYEAREAVILIAEQVIDGGLNVSIYSTLSTIPSFVKMIEIAPRPGMPPDLIYEDAVREVQAALRQDWKAKTEINSDQVSLLKARARFSTVQEWVKLKRSIENVSGVSLLKVQGLKPKEAIIRIEYKGSEERLIQAFSQAGITLNAPFQSNPYYAQMPGNKMYDIGLGPIRRY